MKKPTVIYSAYLENRKTRHAYWAVEVIDTGAGIHEVNISHGRIESADACDGPLPNRSGSKVFPSQASAMRYADTVDEKKRNGNYSPAVPPKRNQLGLMVARPGPAPASDQQANAGVIAQPDMPKNANPPISFESRVDAFV